MKFKKDVENLKCTQVDNLALYKRAEGGEVSGSRFI